MCVLVLRLRIILNSFGYIGLILIYLTIIFISVEENILMYEVMCMSSYMYDLNIVHIMF